MALGLGAVGTTPKPNQAACACTDGHLVEAILVLGFSGLRRGEPRLADSFDNTIVPKCPLTCASGPTIPLEMASLEHV